MCKRWKFSILLDVDKHADSDNENACDLNANECRDDGLKSKYTENVCIQTGEGKLRQVLMVCSKHIELAGNFTWVCPMRLVT